jgi:hypothetical protein
MRPKLNADVFCESSPTTFTIELCHPFNIGNIDTEPIAKRDEFVHWKQMLE